MGNDRPLARMGGIGHVGRQSTTGVLAALLALMSDSVLAFDANRSILLANAQAESLTGLTAGELVGTDVCDLLFDANKVPVRSDEPDGAPDGGHASRAGGLVRRRHGEALRALPFATDGSLCLSSLRLAEGGATTVAVRCDRASAPGETYLLVMHTVDARRASDNERDRLVNELSLANRRLSGTLRIVLDTIDAQDVGSLFGLVLEQISETMEASGTCLYLAEADGFRLRGATDSLRGHRVPQFLAYGEGIETIVTRAGHALRLRLVAPGEADLRAGALRSRELVDEESGEPHRVPARQVPPFESLLCVPVWFAGHVISLIEVGWADARPTRRDDARLMDSVAQYLSAELAAAITAMRTERAQHLDAVACRVRESFESEASGTDQYEAAMQRVAEALEATLVPIYSGTYDSGCIMRFGDGEGDVDVPMRVEDLVAGHLDAGVAVMAVAPDGALGSWLVSAGHSANGALVHFGDLGGKRRSALFLRAADAEPLDEVELAFLRRVCDDVRAGVEAGERRSKDTRISQALQLGMRNELQDVDGITARGLYSSATEAAFVGGDFYDLVRLPGRRACVILGDVSGKGVESASVSAAVKTALGAYAWEGLSPAHMVRLLNDFLLGFSRLETFATLFVGIADLRHATLTYCSAGHPPALLLREKTGEMETLDVQSGVVGAFEGMAYRDGRISIAAGDRLVLYTDGVTEARDPKGAFFGEQGLRDAVMEQSEGPFDTMLDRLLSTLDAFTGRSLEDDVALVALRFDDPGEAPAPTRRRRAAGQGSGRQ